MSVLCHACGTTHYWNKQVLFDAIYFCCQVTPVGYTEKRHVRKLKKICWIRHKLDLPKFADKSWRCSTFFISSPISDNNMLIIIILTLYTMRIRLLRTWLICLRCAKLFHAKTGLPCSKMFITQKRTNWGFFKYKSRWIFFFYFVNRAK